MGWKGGIGRRGRLKKKGPEVFPLQPSLPILPVLPGYRLNVPKNAERLFGSLHLVPSEPPVKVFWSVWAMCA